MKKTPVKRDVFDLIAGLESDEEEEDGDDYDQAMRTPRQSMDERSL